MISQCKTMVYAYFDMQFNVKVLGIFIFLPLTEKLYRIEESVSEAMTLKKQNKQQQETDRYGLSLPTPKAFVLLYLQTKDRDFS